MVATSVVYAIFAVLMHALGLWRGATEQRQDMLGAATRAEVGRSFCSRPGDPGGHLRPHQPDPHVCAGDVDDEAGTYVLWANTAIQSASTRQLRLRCCVGSAVVLMKHRAWCRRGVRLNPPNLLLLLLLLSHQTSAVAWWVITLWLTVLGVGFGVFAGAIYTFKASITNTLVSGAHGHGGRAGPPGA